MTEYVVVYKINMVNCDINDYIGFLVNDNYSTIE